MSRWFSRGWTLQELLAPRWVTFYGADWVNIGSKGTLRHTISSITGIPADILINRVLPDMMPVAVRMSWAADRFTTRAEDVAYCLMGIFRVNMPLLYGEGQQAFFRLQREIIKKYTDHSIFAWRLGSDSKESSGGMLAASPTAFRYSSEITSSKSSDAYFVTNKGLNFQSVLFSTTEPNIFLLPLDCTLNSKPIAIFLRTLEEGGDQYTRTCLGKFGDGTPESNRIAKPAEPLFIQISGVDEEKHSHAIGSSVSVMVILSDDYGDVTFEAYPQLEPYEFSEWDFRRKTWFPEFWRFEHNNHQEDMLAQRRILTIHNEDRMDRFAVVFPLAGAYSGSIGTDVVLAESLSESAQTIDGAYIKGTRKGLAQDTERSFVTLPSGWSVFVSISKARANKARDWDLFRVQIQVKQNNPQISRLPWIRPEGQCVWVTLPVLHQGFNVLGPVKDSLTSEVYWARHDDSYILCTTESKAGEASVDLPVTVARKALIGLARLGQVFFGTQSEREEKNLNGTLEFTVSFDDEIRILRLMVVLRRENFPPFELKVSTYIHGLQERFGSEEPGTYSARLEDGRPLLLVTVRNSRVKSVADFLVSITMGDLWGKGSSKGIPWEEGEENILATYPDYDEEELHPVHSDSRSSNAFSEEEGFWAREDPFEKEGYQEDKDSLNEEDNLHPEGSSDGGVYSNNDDGEGLAVLEEAGDTFQEEDILMERKDPPYGVGSSREKVHLSEVGTWGEEGQRSFSDNSPSQVGVTSPAGGLLGGELLETLESKHFDFSENFQGEVTSEEDEEHDDYGLKCLFMSLDIAEDAEI